MKIKVYSTMKLEEFQNTIGVTFSNPALLEQAFTHRSYINENRETTREHNERLEFLGDAVLELAVTEFLYEQYPQTNEGELTSYRAALVNTDSLAQTALDLTIDDLLLLSKGEAKDTGRARYYIYANTIEAIIGAIHLDQGYEIARGFIMKHIVPRIEEILEKGTWMDAKSRFQEKAQEVTGITPTYEKSKEVGPDHDKYFTVGVHLGEELVAEGEGHAKQEAEQAAARNGLRARGWE